jgi:flavin reductase (DIM6/NTAB) family NADH-FMN oxidoreductase RutF
MSTIMHPPTSPGSAGTPAEQRRFRDALGTFATGVTIVSTRLDDLVHGMTANGFMSVSLDPALVVVSIATSARMHDILLRAGRYGVSVLGRDQEPVSRHFAGRPQPTAIALAETLGTPLVEGALTHVVADVVDAHAAGDHTLFIGEVLHFAHRSGEPLIFHSGAYRRLIASPVDPTRSDEWLGDLHAWRLNPSGKIDRRLA